MFDSDKDSWAKKLAMTGLSDEQAATVAGIIWNALDELESELASQSDLDDLAEGVEVLRNIVIELKEASPSNESSAA